MEYRQLGSTGLRVSGVALVTIELGMDYGFRGSEHYRRPDPQEVIRIVHRALDLGMNLIDSARAYGTSEELIGKALKLRPAGVVIASKVGVPDDDETVGSKQIREAILGSIEASLRALQLDTIDVMQIHNATLAIPSKDEVLRALEDARQAGKIRFFGASCYGEEVPLAVLENTRFDTLQVPLYVLDRRVIKRVFPKAIQRGVGILVRSAFLQGVLASDVNFVPERLAPVREAALRIFCAVATHCAEPFRNGTSFLLIF